MAMPVLTAIAKVLAEKLLKKLWKDKDKKTEIDQEAEEILKNEDTKNKVKDFGRGMK